MPEKMNQSPAEMLNQNAAVAQNAEVPAPAAPVTPARQSYAEKVQGLTIDERNWMLAKSKAAAMAQLPEGFLPQTYTGNPGACAIACEMALRMGVSHLFVMQNLYVVHGMPTWSGKSCKALIDNCGQFAGRTRYRMEGEEGTETWGCRLIGVDKLTGEKVEGPKVTVKMAKDAGWWNKNGSYWPKMTEMMLKYRAAAYFARAECPEVLMGRLVYEPELKTTQNGTNVCSFRIAVDRSFTRQGEERKADFIDVTAWRQTAEFVSKYFQKGSMIAIEGSLQTTSYQDKNGNNRTKVEVVASNVSFCGSKAAERAVVKDFDQQTANHVQQAKAAQSAPQAQQTSFASQSYRAERKSPDGQPVAVPDAEAHDSDGFSIIDDSDDLPF